MVNKNAKAENSNIPTPRYDAILERRKTLAKTRVKKVETSDLEAPVVVQILKWLKANGFRCWRNNGQGTVVHTSSGAGAMVPSSRPGSSDIEGQLKDGRYFCIEVKRPDWTPPKEEVR